MIRIGIVGLGKMGLLHASLLSALDGARVVAVCEQRAALRRFARKMLPGVRVLKDVAALGDVGVDAVYVTTPPGSHFPVVSALMASGVARHVFVEKPLAASAGQAREMCTMVGRATGTHMVGFQKRFAVTFRKAKAILADGLLGDVVSFDAHAYSSDFVGLPGANLRASQRGGVLRDLGCHAIDAVLWFLGEVEVTPATARPARALQGARPDGATESVTVHLRTASGAPGALSVSAGMADRRLPEISVSVVGTRGRLGVNDDRVELDLDTATHRVWHRQTLQDQVSFLLADPEYLREDEHFVQAVSAGARAAPSFEDGLRVEALIDRVQTAIGDAA